jgi:hypothetical protein
MLVIRIKNEIIQAPTGSVTYLLSRHRQRFIKLIKRFNKKKLKKSWIILQLLVRFLPVTTPFALPYRYLNLKKERFTKA